MYTSTGADIDVFFVVVTTVCHALPSKHKIQLWSRTIDRMPNVLFVSMMHTKMTSRTLHTHKHTQPNSAIAQY